MQHVTEPSGWVAIYPAQATLRNDTSSEAQDVRNAIAALDTHVQNERALMTSRTDVLADAQNEIKNNISAIEQQLQTHMQAAQTLTQRQDAIMAKLASTQTVPASPWSPNAKKPIREYKIVQSLETLTNNKAEFRDWKVVFKNALGQAITGSLWRQIMAWAEGPSKKPQNMQDFLSEWTDHATTHNIFWTQDEWDELSRDLITVLIAKAERGSEAVLMTKRSECGIHAWSQVNKWYLATSGLGMSQRVARIMRPEQAKRDEDVMHEVEKWLDEMRELRELGRKELPWGYKITALKCIITPKMGEQIEMLEEDVNWNASMSDEKLWEWCEDMVRQGHRTWTGP